MKKKIVIALLFLVLATTLCYGAINTLDSSGLITTTTFMDRLNSHFFVDADDTSELISTVGPNKLIYVPEGEYDFTSTTGRLNVNTSTDYIIFDGLGKVIINVTDTLTSDAFAGGQTSGSDVDVTVSVAKGDRKITVASTTGLAKGDRIILHSNKGLGSGSQQGEQLKIFNISGSNLYLTEPTYFPCLTTDDCNISKIDGVKNIIIRGFIFQGENATDQTHTAITMRGAENVYIYNNDFRDLGYIGIALYNVFNAHIFRNTFSNINYKPSPADGYAFSVSSASRHIFFYDNLVDSLHEGYDSGSTTYGIPLDINIYDNTFMNIKDVAVDSHNMSRQNNIRDNTFIGNQVDIRVNGQGFNIQGNEFRDTTAQSVYIANPISNNTVIDSNIFIDNQGSFGAIDVLGTHNAYIKNNFFKDVTLGIRAVYSTTDLILSNNIFVDSTTGTNITASTGYCSDNVFSGVTTHHVNDCYEDKRVDNLIADTGVCVGRETCTEEVEIHGIDAVKVKVNSSNAYGMIELWGAEGQSTYLTAYPDEKDDATDQIQIRFNDGGDIEFKNNGGVVHNFEYDGDYYTTGSIYALGTYISLNDQTPSQEVHFEINDNPSAEANANSNVDIIIEDTSNTGIQALIGRDNRFWFMVGDEDAGYPFYWYYDNPTNKYVIRVNNSDVFSIDGTYELRHNGEVEFTGISGDGTDKCVCIKADGNLGTCDCASCSCS